VQDVFRDLLATAGVEEHCELRSPVGFMALHGGLEAATFEIARASAERCGASLYAVVQPEGLSWHVPSHRFDPADSPRLASFCSHVEVVVSLHGYGGVRGSERRWTTIVLGGGGRAQAAVVAGELRRHLPDYTVVDDIDEVPRAYRGLHPRNPVNRVRTAGVQVELPPRVRGRSPMWADHDVEAEPFTPHTRALVDALASAATELRRDATPGHLGPGPRR